MKLNVKRFACYRHAVSGHAMIDGIRVCDTLENEFNLLPEGTYQVRMEHTPLAIETLPMVGGTTPMVMGNGIFGCRDHSIVVGESLYLGFLTNGDHLFQQLRWRLYKQIVTFHHEVYVTIEKSDDFFYVD